MSCVVTSHPEFIELSKKLNLHPNFLESIVHKYQNSSKENEGKYPSVEYVLDSLKGTSMTNASEGQVKLWEAKFSTPKVFNTEKEANTYINEATKYFSEESVIVEQDLDGKYKVTVVEPYTAEYIKEVNDILNNAPRDSEGRLLAPNGKPSNLTEKQYAQVRTKAFINWFGDWINNPANASKVIDENGEPLVVYHGGMAGINTFLNQDENPDYENTKHQGYTNKDRIGIYFSKYRDTAKNYKRPYGKKGDIYEVFLNIKNPKNVAYATTLKNRLIRFGTFGIIDNPTVDNIRRRELDSIYQGYDGVNHQNGEEYVVFDSNQIKSATDNIGTFSTTKNDIYTERELTKTIGFSIDIRLQSLFNRQLNGEQITIKELLSFISEDSDYYPIVKLLSSEKKNRGPLLTGVKIKIDDTIVSPSSKNQYENRGNTRRAYYNASTKTIHINAAAQFRNGKVDSVLIHEILHAITVDKIVNNPKLRTEFEAIIDEFISKNPEERFNYGKEEKHRIEEFIADIWSNPEIIQKLKNTKSSRGTDLSIWNKIKNFFVGIFQDMSSDSLFAEASVKLNELLDSPITGKSFDSFYDNEQTNTEQQLQQSLDISQKLDNLLSSTKITASEVRDIANKVMYWLSDHITDLQTTPELANKIYGDQYKDVDFSKMGRMEIVKAIGVNNILTKAKQNFSPQQNNFNSRKLVAKARLIQENWEAIVYLASNTFGELESFNISYSDNSVIESVNNEEESYTQNIDSESIQEVEGNLQEHWQIESRTQSVITSMSKLVRQALQHCYILTESVNEEGTIGYTPLLDSWGIKERVPVKDAVNSILRWTQGSITLSNMKDKLREKSKDNPWITQILSRLDDMSGKEADFQSQFFTVFNKHFQSYDVVTLTDDKYTALPSNEFPALKEIVGNISALFKIGEHPLFRLNGINKELFKDFNIVYNELVELTKKDFSTLDVTDVAKKIAFLANVLGFNTDYDFILSSINRGSLNSMMKALYYINDALTANLDNPNYNPFDYKSVGSIIGNLRKFLMPLTDKLEDVTAQTVYSDGKMYQSYVTPSYMTKLMQKFHLTGEAFIEFIENEFAKYEWFKKDTGDIETGWKNSWLRELVKDSNARETFAHKVQLNFNRHNYMKNMSDVEYILSVLTEYFSQKPTSSRVPAWFRVPMLSNKPSSEFIRFYSERGSDYQDTITLRLKEVFNQELSRIQTVMQRNFDEGDPEFIKNFDKNGRRFCFLDFMNQYLDGKSKNTELGKLLRDKLEGKEIDEVQLSSLVTEAIKEAMTTKVNSILSDWDNMGVFKAAEKISNIGTNIREALENFIWNDTLAAINIMELTITDPAYYKDAEDLQKRFAQIHSPGIRGNVEATDYDGNPVTDGIERTIYLTDFDGFKSNIIDNLTIVFDRKIDTAPESEKETLTALKESVIKQYQKINVADAQAYSSPHSYRKKAFIFGKWSKEAEQVYQRLLDGDYSYTDLQVAFQPLKPFKYSQIEKSSEVENSPMSSLKVPIQNKNSEYLLVMASAILQKEDTGRPNLLRAIYEVMEESAERNPTKGIDTVQFTSAVKSGLMGEIDLTEFLEDENGEAKAKERIKASIYADGVSGEYDKICVHETPFEDYCIQQETPAHFKNHEQAHGSQIRYIIPSDLEEVDYEGNPVTYKVEGRKLTAQQFKDEYEATIAENIQESINNLISELNLQGTKKERNVALRNILQREILGNPRYGVELLQACELDANGEFRIPLGDPIQSKRIEQLINSIIKNRINKQTIAGGPVVQVSNFGTSKQLNIRFKDKKGELLQTRKEFEGTDVEYKKYIEEHQAGIAYFECYAPAYTDALFSNFMDADGNIDIKAIETLNPELLKMVGYRIPSEDKYSCTPLKIVGFLPKEAGDGIMLPYEITLIAGSDFDIDKMYLMRKDIPIKTKPKKEIFDLMYEDLLSSKKNPSYKDKQMIKESLTIFLDNPQEMRKGDKLFQYIWNLYKKVAFTAIAPTEGKSYRDNKIIDMSFEVLTHETTADKVLNPGGFEEQKKIGYLVEAMRNNPDLSFDYLYGLSIDDLKDLSYKDKNLIYMDVQAQFYKQNSAAGSLIGIFAVSKIAHAVLESNGICLDIENIIQSDVPLTIADTTIEGTMTVDSKYDRKGNLIGKILGSLVASSADAVKDPVLNLMNINGYTANTLNTLIRLGMPFEDAALFLSQECITQILKDYNKEIIDSPTSLGNFINSRLSEIEDSMGNISLIEEAITKEELIKGIRKTTPEIEYKVLLAFNKLLKIGNALSSLSFVTRFNSMSSAVGPLVIDNLITEQKLKEFSEFVTDSDGNMLSVEDVLNSHPIIKQFSRTLSMARFLLNDMPAYKSGFSNILNALEGTNLAYIRKNRDLLSKLSDFYQSYLLVASGVINPKELNRYINNFPKWFVSENIKAKYPDNKLIQAVRIGIDKNTGLTVLSIDTSGLLTQEKEELSAAWVDLHNTDKDLAIYLFKYNFFRGGIGFTPKSFMHLLPTYIKEKIEGYKETYNKVPSTLPVTVIDQFIRNNAHDNKLVPFKKGIKFNFMRENGYIEVVDEDAKSLSNTLYFKMTLKGRTVLYKQISNDDTRIIYKEVPVLGNNKSYLEISNNDIEESLENTEPIGVVEDAPQVPDNTEPDVTPTTSTKKDEFQVLDLLYKVLENGKTVTTAKEAVAKHMEYASMSKEKQKSLESGMKKYFINRFKQLGIEFDQELVDNLYNTMCK